MNHCCQGRRTYHSFGLHSLFFIIVGLFIARHLFNASPTELHSLNYGWALFSTVCKYMMPLYMIILLVMHKDKKAGWMQMIALLFCVCVVAYGLKQIIHEARPSGGPYAFPSGHTALAFTAVFFAGFRYGWKPFLVLLPFGILTGVGRVLSHQHWTHDVIGSVVLTAILALCIVRRKMT